MANWNSALITWAKKCPVNASLVSLYIINLEDPSHFQQMDLFREAQPQPEHQQGMEEWWTDMLSWLIRHRDMVLRNLGTRLRKQTKDNETSGQIKVFWQDIEQKKIAKTLAAKDNLANLQVLTDIKTGALALKMSLQGVEALPPSRNLTSHANQTEVELGGQKAQATLLHTSGSANRDNQRRVVVSPGPRPSFSAVHTPPLGSGSSSPTLSPPPRPVFNSSDDEYEENEADGEEVFDRDNGDKDEVFGRPCGDMSWIKERPEFTFSLPLSKDWGPQITESYNKIKEKTSLGYEQVDEIALLSGVLHLNKAHVGFQANEITVITNDVLHRFYSNQQKEKDVERSIEAAALWGTWVQKWGSMHLLSCLSKELGDAKEVEVDVGPVVDLIMESYHACQEKDILPILFVALYVFRNYNTWSKIESESDAMLSVISPILREFMNVTGHVQFKCLNAMSTAGKSRKTVLGQGGQARHPDIVGRTEEGHEAYYGELKGMHPSTQLKNADTLRIAVFTKDSLDNLLPELEEELPLISFQSIGNDIVFFLGARIGNTVIHARISDLKMPICLSELKSVDQLFFFRLFQIQSLVRLTSKRLKQKRQEHIGDSSAFPTLDTPYRNMVMRIRSGEGVVRRRGRESVEGGEVKRRKGIVEA